MTTKYAQHISTRGTPQNESIPGKQMVKNSAGGFAFAVDNWKRLERFLVLGAEGGTYYATEQKLTKENAQCVFDCHAEDPARAINAIEQISVSGRAPKNAPAVFALAMLSRDPLALAAMQKVCRTSTDFFSFVDQAQNFRGRGRAFNRALRQWYTEKDPRQLAYQCAKYQQRDGWSHRDILRLCKPKSDGSRCEVFKWAVGKPGVNFSDEALDPITAYEMALADGQTIKEMVRLIETYGLVRECIPTQFLKVPEVWEALLDRMPMTAMIRNLGKMGSIGLLKPLSSASQVVVDRLADRDRIRKARVHPLVILIALSIYQAGRGLRGSLTWSADSRIVEALNEAFYLAFDNVEPTGKRWLLGLDVSGSMGSSIMNTFLSCRDAAAAMAMVTVRTEPMTHALAFTSASAWSRRYAGVQEFPLSKTQRLDDVVKNMNGLPFGGTDCALPMLYALENKLDVDVFTILTDSETWAGTIHPCQALQRYRDKTGIPAKLAVVGMASSGFSIADPSDAGMMDVVGFDAAAPIVLADFAGA